MKRRWILRRLTLIHGGEPFLDRWGIVTRWGGFYLHHIAGPDPGMDLHDHPWSFVTVILRGGYRERRMNVSNAAGSPGIPRERDRWHAYRMPLGMAHRITSVTPRTWTLVLRGPDRRVWGFYPPTGRVDWDRYDYETRRPVTVARRTS